MILGGCSADKTADVDGIKTVKMDGFTLSWIRDTPEPKTNALSLFPTAPAALVDSLGLQDGVPSSMSTFLLQSKDCNILFDTGLGADFSMLQSGLETLGCPAEDVDYIYLTHLHGDHVGGLVKDGKAAFPDSKLYIGRVEYEAWMAMEPSKIESLVSILELYKDRTVLFEFGDELPGGVLAISAVGHTPGHTAFRKGSMLIVGDIMHAAALQMVDPSINAIYDMDQEQSAKTRAEMIDYAKENKLLMCGMHMPDPAMIDFR